MRSTLVPSLILALSAGAAQALDLAPLWDFSQPAASEQRLRAALATAQGDAAFILRTQFARSWGLRRDFAKARALLAELQPALTGAGPEARVRYHLELGRSHASATHPPEALTDDARRQARAAFQTALDTARGAGLDGLAIDAIHMFAFVDTAPAQQLHWAQQALALSLSSTQPEAQRWQASIRNNLGHALHQLGRFEEALAQFQQALALRQRAGKPQAVHQARWMVAWTLRALQRSDEALQMQLALEREADAAGAPDPYVFEELETLYRERGDSARAAHYAQRRRQGVR